MIIENIPIRIATTGFIYKKGIPIGRASITIKSKTDSSIKLTRATINQPVNIK